MISRHPCQPRYLWRGAEGHTPDLQENETELWAPSNGDSTPVKEKKETIVISFSSAASPMVHYFPEVRHMLSADV